MRKLEIAILLIVLMMIVAVTLASCANEAADDTRSSAVTPGGDGSEAITGLVSYPIVDTGQTKCYDNTLEIATPGPGQAFYGQDAQFAGNQPAYHDNGDGTVTDLNTDLVWQQIPGRRRPIQKRSPELPLAARAGIPTGACPASKNCTHSFSSAVSIPIPMVIMPRA